MLWFTGKGSAQTRGGVTRRDFLHAGALAPVGLSLPQFFGLRARGAVGRDADERACVMIFNLGAPSQIDLFDPKPDAPAEVRGPFKTIKTASPDIQLTELLPLHARLADKFSLVRSVYHTAAAVHDTGHQMLQTGRPFAGGVNAPHVGCALQFLRGARNELPANVILPAAMGPTGGNMPHGQDAGFLGKAYDPFVLPAGPGRKGPGVRDLLPPASTGGAAGGRRKRLREVVDDQVRAFEATEAAARMDADFQKAFTLVTSTRARDAFDLAKEPQSVRDRYGMTRFGQCCLLARRLVEAGVRFVTINTFLTVFDEVTWDVHGSKPFTTIAQMRDVVCPMYDRGYTALIEDLSGRGLLDKTLVCNLSEFGRAPRINPAGGRDHWPACWSIYFAGGGVQGGRVVGKSDDLGAYPADRPVSPGEVVATIYHGLGIDLAATLPGPQGRPLAVVDAGTRPVTELF